MMKLKDEFELLFKFCCAASLGILRGGGPVNLVIFLFFLFLCDG